MLIPRDATTKEILLPNNDNLFNVLLLLMVLMGGAFILITITGTKQFNIGDPKESNKIILSAIQGIIVLIICVQLNLVMVLMKVIVVLIVVMGIVAVVTTLMKK